MRATPTLALLVTAIACSLFAACAQAQRARVFVASYGSDANICTFGSPCKTFQNAVNVVADHGEVTAIDSAGFGPVTITNKSVTITSPDGVEAGIAVASGGTGITVNAGLTDTIVLRGLTIDGANVGSNGIVVNSAGSLTVADCTLQNFVFAGGATGNGILMQPTSGTLDFTITNTTASNNGNAGINYNPPSGSPSANGVIDHVVANTNQFGINVYAGNATAGTTVVAVSNSNASNNSNKGIDADNGSSGLATKVSIDNVSASGNVTAGVAAFDTANVLLGRSVITGNGNGVVNNTQPNTFYTYGDNRINLNTGSEIAGTTPALNTSFLQQ
jgi:hypothetical protein